MYDMIETVKKSQGKGWNSDKNSDQQSSDFVAILAHTPKWLWMVPDLTLVDHFSQCSLL